MVIFSIHEITLVLTRRLYANLGAVDAPNDIWEARFLVEFAFVLVSFCLRRKLNPVVDMGE